MNKPESKTSHGIHRIKGDKSVNQSACESPWIATVMSLAWSGDILLTKNSENWQGSVSMGKNPADLTILTLTKMSPTGWKLTMRPTSENLGLSEVTACNETEHRDFLRFEFPEMTPSSSPSASKINWNNHMTVQVDRRTELRSKFGNSPFGLSYLPVLRHFLEIKPNPKILEWGPGRSRLCSPSGHRIPVF